MTTDYLNPYYLQQVKVINDMAEKPIGPVQYIVKTVTTDQGRGPTAKMASGTGRGPLLKDFVFRKGCNGHNVTIRALKQYK